MKAAIIPWALVATLLTTLPCLSSAQVRANQDTIVVPGGTLAGREHAGALEATINGDTTSSGARVNPNRVYALNEGQCYFQLAPISVIDPTGTLAIVGVPSAYGKTKPIILIANTGAAHVVINGSATNQVYGSLKLENIYYVTQELDGYQNNELFFCGTKNKLPQSLIIDNCLFEFCAIDLFDCSNEWGAIGGWPYGAKFRITNSYFRNMFFAGQWWGSRVFQCKHPIDTLWIENCTTTTAGLTFLQQNELTDFEYINHNTIVNNMKYWLLSPYHRVMYITNNIFINQNWVGEDTDVVSSGQDPDRQYMGTINIDTNNTTNGEVVQSKYMVDSTHFSSALDLSKMQVFISDNINYDDSLLINGYYNSSRYKLSSLNALPGYPNWPAGPFPVRNVPGQWMNSRTQALFAAYGPPNGGFIETRTSTANPGTATPGIADASLVDSMAVWNQNQWGDPRFAGGDALQHTRYIYGDYNPTTLPGIINTIKTDTITTGAAGIAKFTDLSENFSQSVHLSVIDGLPIGALIWDDAKLAVYSSTTDWALVHAKYLQSFSGPESISPESGVAKQFSLLQNYPNPFNPTTVIRYALPLRSHVTLTVFNTLGQQVATLVNETEEPGEHSIKFEGSGLASGVYFYRLRAGEYVSTKRLVLVR